MKHYISKKQLVSAVKITKKVGHLGLNLTEIDSKNEFSKCWTGIPDVYVNIANGFVITMTIEQKGVVRAWGGIGDFLVIKDNGELLFMTEEEFYSTYIPRRCRLCFYFRLAIWLAAVSFLVYGKTKGVFTIKDPIIILYMVCLSSYTVDLYKKYKEE